MKIVIKLNPEMLLPIAKGLRSAIENELKNGWDYPNGLQSVELLDTKDKCVEKSCENCGQANLIRRENGFH